MCSVVPPNACPEAEEFSSSGHSSSFTPNDERSYKATYSGFFSESSPFVSRMLDTPPPSPQIDPRKAEIVAEALADSVVGAQGSVGSFRSPNLLQPAVAEPEFDEIIGVESGWYVSLDGLV